MLLDLTTEGLSLEKIGAKYDTSQSTISRVKKKYIELGVMTDDRQLTDAGSAYLAAE
jgi:transposase